MVSVHFSTKNEPTPFSAQSKKATDLAAALRRDRPDKTK
jgi:hypothetical protein